SKVILLKLITLYLVLFGAILLIGRPVLARTSSDLSVSEDYSLVGKAQDEGYEEGVKAGYKDAVENKASDENPTPLTNPYSNNQEAKTTYEGAYRDGYELGYDQGWEVAHPVQSYFKWLWGRLFTWFFGST
ncbi:TPA: hypothetical protein ACQ4Y9_001746, partial [Streptococcus pyogenes]